MGKPKSKENDFEEKFRKDVGHQVDDICMPPPPMRPNTCKANVTPAPGSPKAKAKNESLFKTPLKQVQPNTVSGCLKKVIYEEMASMNIDKPLLGKISQSATKPTINRSMLFNKIKTPASVKKAPTNFTSTFKFDPTCVTGIPLIKPKKATIPEPFVFASDKLAAKRAIPK